MAEINLKQLASVEFFVALAVGVFAAGGLWFGLGSAVAGNSDDIKEIRDQTVELSDSVQQIETDVAVIKAGMAADRRLQSEQQHELLRVLNQIRLNPSR